MVLTGRSGAWLAGCGAPGLRRLPVAVGCQAVLVAAELFVQALYFLGYLDWRRGDGPEARRRFDGAFAALGPQAAPAPGEGDVRKAEKPLPRRGAFSGHWAYLARGGVRLEDAFRELDGELRPSRAAAARK